MSPFDYDEFKSETVKFSDVGQEVEGRIEEIAPYTGMNNNKAFKYTLALRDGRRVEMLCTQTDLKQKLADLAPQQGDVIHVKYASNKHVGQPEPMKVFEVQVTRAGNSVADSPETATGAKQPF